jgi:iron(III) transport system permease protein
MYLLLAIFASLMLFPLFIVVRQGLYPDIILEALATPVLRLGLYNSFIISIVTTFIVFLLAVPLALLADRYDFPGKRFTNLLVMLPMILPPFVGALGFQQVFGHYGVVNSILTGMHLPAIDWLGGSGKFYAVCIIEALHLYPILYLNLVTALGNIDPSLDEAAQNLGAGKFTRLFKISLPMVSPGLFAGGSIVLIWSFTELGTPLMLGYNTVTPVQIFNGINELETNPLPYSLVVILLLISIIMYFTGKFALNKKDMAQINKGTATASSIKLSGVKSLTASGLFLLITIMATLPHIALIFGAFAHDWYNTILPSSYTMIHFQAALSHEIVVPSIINSVKYSSMAMLLCILLGIPTAILIVRWKPFGWQIIDALAMLPLAVPGIIMAFGYLSLCAKISWLNSWLDPINNPTLLLVVAYAMRRIPYVVRAVAAGLEQLPISLEEAARNLGANSWYTLRKITVPLIAANLVVGALFAFSFSMLEVSDSLILAQKSAYYPITKAIFELSQILGQGSWIACAFGLWAMLFLAATLFAASKLLNKKIGSLFKF